ncbi:MAG: hypothetical protein NTY35_08220 [Planctomycetota bacterium]|nr:hypothetical protein [Planctomycetota bacterium]
MADSAQPRDRPADPPDLTAVPRGYRRTETPRGRLAVADWAAAELARAGFTLESDGDLRASEVAGRKALSQTADGQILVRAFTHGGLLRFLTGRRFRDPNRPFVELALSAWLASHGVDTPPVAAARARRAAILGHELALATRRIGGARDLESHLVDVRAGRAARASLRPALREFGALVARMHGLGLLHADLTPKNVLVEPRGAGAPRLWILDLDRSRVEIPLQDSTRRTNLRRLWRFVDRRERRDGRALARSDVARFLVAYAPDRTSRHALWRAVARDHASAAIWHRIGWALDRARR